MIRIRQIKIDVLKDSEENLKSNISKKLKINSSDIKNINIHKRSLDARNKKEIYYVYEVDIEIENEEHILRKNKNQDIFKTPDETYKFIKTGTKKLNNRPVIIGSGPAGLFAAYHLAEQGYNPLIIERGEPVEDRIKSVNKFWETGKLNTNSNVQFGEGGAGTFSDGKLNTLVKDKENRIRRVYELFVKFGAPREILYTNHPHIGTDILVEIVKNMREEIKSMGGEFKYNNTLTNIDIDDNKVIGIEINNNKKIPCDVLILAIGHSARDTFKMLYDKNITMSPKPFAVGIRVQHPQEMINRSQYGDKYKDILEPAPYKLTYKSSSGRGVYSFCMCPGGYVVNSSSEENHLVVNGMSYSKRDSKNANSAIVVTITPEDYGYSPLDGINYQRQLEQKAYNIGNAKIPVQTLKDFKENKVSKTLGTVEPIFKGEYNLANINEILEENISSSIKEAFIDFGRKIKGFDNDDTIISAVESRTSSPVRIERDDNLESNIKGLYPCGEGAGYAGGITSASVDGIKVAEQIEKIYISVKI